MFRLLITHVYDFLRASQPLKKRTIANIVHKNNNHSQLHIKFKIDAKIAHIQLKERTYLSPDLRLFGRTGFAQDDQSMAQHNFVRKHGKGCPELNFELKLWFETNKTTIWLRWIQAPTTRIIVGITNLQPKFGISTFSTENQQGKITFWRTSCRDVVNTKTQMRMRVSCVCVIRMFHCLVAVVVAHQSTSNFPASPGFSLWFPSHPTCRTANIMQTHWDKNERKSGRWKNFEKGLQEGEAHWEMVILYYCS